MQQRACYRLKSLRRNLPTEESRYEFTAPRRVVEEGNQETALQYQNLSTAAFKDRVLKFTPKEKYQRFVSNSDSLNTYPKSLKSGDAKSKRTARSPSPESIKNFKLHDRHISQPIVDVEVSPSVPQEDLYSIQVREQEGGLEVVAPLPEGSKRITRKPVLIPRSDLSYL